MEQDLKVLLKLQKHIDIGDYRSLLVRMRVSGGYLYIDFFSVSDRDGGSLEMKKTKNSRRIDLTNPTKPGGGIEPEYGEYFASKQESLLKETKDRKFAKDLTEKLKRAYSSGEILDSKEEFVFIEKSLREYYFKIAKARNEKLLKQLSPILKLVAIRLLEPISRAEGTLKTALMPGRIARIGGKALIVGDIAANVYMTYGDLHRWQNGEITGGYVAFKAALRTGQVTLTYFMVFSPEPGPFTRAAAGISAAILIAVDFASDAILGSGDSGMKRIYLDVDHAERFASCRQVLLASIP